MAVDLHLHSNASDGAMTPSELVDYAADLQLECIALTDHNTTAGVDEARRRAADLPIRFIAGIEMTAVLDDVELHILGYFIDPENPDLLARCRLHRLRMVERLGEMVRRLQGRGFEVGLPEVLEEAGNALPGRPHLARILVRRGYAHNIADAFDRHIGNHSDAYLPVESESPEDLYRMIRQAGGIAGIAHPGALGRGRRLSEADICRHRDWGAECMEVFHPGHDAQATAFYLEMARRLHLAPTGGSDYHGLDPGSSEMALKICPSWVERELRAFHASRRPQ